MMVTPAERPWRRSPKSVVGVASISAALIWAMLLPISRRRAFPPVPVTITSSISSVEAPRVKSTVTASPSATVTSRRAGSKPMYRASRV